MSLRRAQTSALRKLHGSINQGATGRSGPEARVRSRRAPARALGQAGRREEPKLHCGTRAEFRNRRTKVPAESAPQPPFALSGCGVVAFTRPTICWTRKGLCYRG